MNLINKLLHLTEFVKYIVNLVFCLYVTYEIKKYTGEKFHDLRCLNKKVLYTHTDQDFLAFGAIFSIIVCKIPF